MQSQNDTNREIPLFLSKRGAIKSAMLFYLDTNEQRDSGQARNISRLGRLPWPYLKPNALVDPSETIEFWMNRISDNTVQLNKSAGARTLFPNASQDFAWQFDRCASCLLFARRSVFVTADRAFFFILKEVSKYLDRSTEIFLVNRASSSTLHELQQLRG
jgi:hypothetical protein